MKFTLSWLKKFLNIDSSIEEIAATLNKIGFEVESITDRSKELESFEVAKIIDAKPHPSADKLQICNVETKKGNLQIVCGAPNARAGINVVLAPIGAVIPNGNFVIKQAKIRDVESSGMLCSAAELFIGNDSGGIIELPENAVIGENFAKYFGLDDTTIEIDVTPNRGDCLGVYGIARELAAAGLGALKEISWPKMEVKTVSNIIENENDCAAFCSIELKNITNGKSPLWLQNLLKNIGCNPISSVVDVTNYICYSFGRPMHAYDAKCLSGSLKIARAKKGENFDALSDKSYELNEGDLVVRDDNSIQALAGIIGGKLSSCSEGTNNIILESAYFNKELIINTGRRLAIETDSRFRFERSTDIGLVVNAACFAAEMVREICGGEILAVHLAGNIDYKPNIVSIDESIIEKSIGIKIDIKDAGNILEKLGFKVNYHGNRLDAANPSWRHDISITEDLIEEIVRIYGFEKIPSVPISSELKFRLASPTTIRMNLARRIMAANGYDELVTWSFMNSKFAKLFSNLQDNLHIQNPISQDLNYMRPSLLPNLLEAIAKNSARNIENGAFFEVGPIFLGTAPTDEKMHVSAVRWGNIESNLHSGSRESDVFDVKADMEIVLNELGISTDSVQISTDNLPTYYHPTRSAAITLGKNLFGYFGEIHPLVLKEYDIGKRVVAMEVNISAIPESRLKYGKRGPYLVSDYQAAKRDFAFVVDRQTPAGKIVRQIASLDKTLIKNVEIFDVYLGDKIDQSKKSVAFRVTIQADDRTLSDAELTSIHSNIVSSIEKNFGGELRR